MAKIHLSSMVGFLKDGLTELGLKFDFHKMVVIDVQNKNKVVGSFNRLNSGKIYIEPLVLVTIRTRCEDSDLGTASDKLVKDAMVQAFDDMRTEFYKNEPFNPHALENPVLQGWPAWIVPKGGAA